MEVARRTGFGEWESRAIACDGRSGATAQKHLTWSLTWTGGAAAVGTGSPFWRGALEQLGPWHGVGRPGGCGAVVGGGSTSRSACGLPECPPHPASARAGD